MPLMIRMGTVVGCSLAATAVVFAQPPQRRAESPAASPVPETLVEQSYPDELVEAGRVRFSADCGFCHGLDTGGGSGGSDLTRSELVAEDVRGDRIIAVIREGRIDAEVPMPARPDISRADLDAIVAFIHDQKSRAESVEGGRRSVSVEDVLSGDARAGERYFDANCTECHSAEGDLDGIASRMEGLNLLQNMLYPRSRPGSSGRATPRVEVRTAGGESISGLLAYQDEFTIALTDAAGRYRSFATRSVEYNVENPLAGHLELLERYTDEDMHDVLAFLHRLR